MDTAADWSAASSLAPRRHDEWPGDSISNLTRSQRLEAMGSAAPVFGGRRQWLAYVGETTGYGSLELSGSSAHRVTLVRPGDAQALREHHRMLRAGRLTPTWPRRPLGSERVHVVDHDELRRTRADAHDSWLAVAQGIARLCGSDDEVALLAGGSLRRTLWAGRGRLGSTHVVEALTELRHAATELATERAAYRAALERMVRLGRHAADAQLAGFDDLARRDLDDIRLEVRTLAAVREEWDGVA